MRKSFHHHNSIETQVSGIPCIALMTEYRRGVPMRITGTGFGDADPAEPDEVEFELLDRRGYRAGWLESKMSDDDYERIEGELIEALL